MLIIEIVEKYLRENGFDGLCLERCCWGCGIGEIANCPEGYLLCEPGYRWDCECCAEQNTCDFYDLDGIHNCYRATKQERGVR